MVLVLLLALLPNGVHVVSYSGLSGILGSGSKHNSAVADARGVEICYIFQLCTARSSHYAVTHMCNKKKELIQEK